MRKIAFQILLIILCVRCFAQVPGTWNEYFSYRNVLQLESVDDNIFALTENGIFIHNVTTDEIQKLTKLNGLSTVGLTCMAYCDSVSSFLVGYSDGTLDIISYPSLRVTAIPTIAQKNIYGSKRINKIVMHHDTALIASEFGMLTFSMQTRKFISTTILSNDGSFVPVKSVASDNNTIYSATTKGIYSISSANSKLSDFSNWKKLSHISYENDTIEQIAALNGTVYYTCKDSIFTVKNGVCEAFKVQMGSVNNLKSDSVCLSIVSAYSAKLYDGNEKLIAYVDSTNSKYWFYNDIVKCNDVVYVATKTDGIVYENKLVVPNGPQTNVIADMVRNGNDLHVVEGNENRWMYGYYDRMNYDGVWTGHTNWEVSKSVSVCAVPFSDKYYYGTYGSGLIESEHTWNYSAQYNQTNSILQSFHSNEDFVIISDITVDRYNNVWMINQGSNAPIVMIDPSNKWYTFEIDKGTRNNTFTQILIDQRGYKWLVGTNKVIAFYENKTYNDVSDDCYVEIPLYDNEGMIASQTNCVAEDLDGEIWIGTNQGIAVHSSPSHVFKDRQSISRIKIEIDGEVGYLLSSESIMCIAVDGANRKWIGTENSGVFLISENGTEQILNFTKTNSPLPSNTITSIVINNETGEVYIGTAEGLVSYTGDATKGDATMEHVVVYPNPVRETYEGDIFIKGIVADAVVKITDISGNIVRTIQANGGTAVWDGRNVYGDRVRTGVYLVYISDETGEYTKVTKIMFIN